LCLMEKVSPVGTFREGHESRKGSIKGVIRERLGLLVTVGKKKRGASGGRGPKKNAPKTPKKKGVEGLLTKVEPLTGREGKRIGFVK